MPLLPGTEIPGRELLRERCQLPLFFGESRYSSDNAVGVAALGYDREVAL